MNKTDIFLIIRGNICIIPIFFVFFMAHTFRNKLMPNSENAPAALEHRKETAATSSVEAISKFEPKIFNVTAVDDMVTWGNNSFIIQMGNVKVKLELKSNRCRLYQ